MRVSTDKLLAIKAFYLGHGIREKSEFKVDALKMIDSAINYLSGSERPEDIKRLIFYKLIKCEILRFDDGDNVNIRYEVQELSKSINKSEIYINYMSMVGVSDRNLHVVGFGNYITKEEKKIKIVKRQLARERHWRSNFDDDYINDYENPFCHDDYTGYEKPLKILGVKAEDLNDKQLQFLNDWSLKDIMIAHNIKYH